MPACACLLHMRVGVQSPEAGDVRAVVMSCLTELLGASRSSKWLTQLLSSSLSQSKNQCPHLWKTAAFW